MENNNLRPTAEFTLSPPAMLPGMLFDRSVSSEVSSDFSLPDYLPEVKRLLRVTATVLPDTRYLGAGSAEYGGTVEYLVCYAGGDGGLWSCRLRQDYRVSTPVDSDLLAHGLDPQADTQIDSTVSRVTGPRKINIRSRLRTRIRAWGEESVEVQVDGEPPSASLERLVKSCPAMRILRASSEPIELSDEIAVSAQGGEMRVVRADGCVHLMNLTAEHESVSCRGELILELITAVEREGMPGVPETTVRKISFAETVPMSGARPGMAVRAWGRCGDFAVELEDERILCDATVWLEVEGISEEKTALTADLYAIDGDVVDQIYREVEVCSLSRAANLNFTLTGSVPVRDAGIDPAAQIVDVNAVPTVDAMELVNGRCVLSGVCRFSVIYRLDGEYGTGEFALPLRYEAECGENLPTDREVEATVIRVGLRSEGDGEEKKFSIDAEIALAMRLYARQKRQILARTAYRPGEARRDCACIVCYPEPEDSLWSVCRRYQVSRAKVEASNHLRRDVECDLPASLEGVEYLLI